MKLVRYFITNNSTITANQSNIVHIATAGKSLSLTDRLTTLTKRLYAKYVTAKSVTEPRNSNYLSLANSTPKACFFIRSTRTSKQPLISTVLCRLTLTPLVEVKFKERRERLSMVACNGKGFALCCIPVIAVFEPVTRYRPKASKLQAVTANKLFTGVIAMIYKFLLLGNKRLTIRIRANSEQEARQQLQFTSPTLCVARINEKGGIYA